MRFILLFVISMTLVCCAVEAGCKGSKCHKRKKNEEARNQDSDPLDKLEDMEAKKKEKPKSEEKESEEEEEKKKTGEQAVAARLRRAEKELRRQKQLSEEQLESQHKKHSHSHHHQHRRHVTGHEHTHSKEVQELAGDVKDAKLVKHESPQRVRRGHFPEEKDLMDENHQLALQWKKINLPNFEQAEEAMKEGRNRQKKHLNHRDSDQEQSVNEVELDLKDVPYPKFGKFGPRGRDRVLPLPTEDREFPLWKKNNRDV